MPYVNLRKYVGREDPLLYDVLRERSGEAELPHVHRIEQADVPPRLPLAQSVKDGVREPFVPPYYRMKHVTFCMDGWKPVGDGYCYPDPPKQVGMYKKGREESLEAAEKQLSHPPRSSKDFYGKQ